jgi:biopolymer transport protein ExbD
MASKRLAYQRRHGHAEEDSIEFQVAPMADVLFVLLVFFMSITTTEVIRSDRDLRLPVAKDGMEIKEKGNQVVINVRWNSAERKGWVMLDGVRYDDPQSPDLVALLKARLQANPMMRVMVRADQNSQFEFIADIMRGCSQAGIANVSFAVTTGEV